MLTLMSPDTHCSRCRKPFKVFASAHTLGYGVVTEDSDDIKICYGCCADDDRQWMRTHDKTTMYLSGGEVTNWPGTLVFKVAGRKTGRHNIAGRRYDVWFKDCEGNEWHGVQYGDNTQILHCQKLKPRSAA